MLVPYQVNGRVRLAQVSSAAGDRERHDLSEEQSRIGQIARRRTYYAGEQYDAENLVTAQALGLDLRVARMPEHHRLHAYSTQIQECVDFVADQLCSGFSVTMDDSTALGVVMTALQANDELTGGDEDEELVVEPLMQECLTAGDLAYEVRWDPFDGTVWPEFWESEQVQFVIPSGKVVERVVRTEVIWVQNEAGQDVQVTERVEYEVMVNGEHGFPECRRAVFYDEDEGPREVQWLGIPILPWGLLRGVKKGLRAFRGESLITSRAMDNADRYDANEQTAYLIARYNSHGNLVVVGDAAQLELKSEGRVEKDVADVLTFPGGTNAFPIQLPTDPQMIEHQRKVTSDAIYANFGLVRVEPDTINGLGGVSGYALEILNRKTEGTFKRIRRQFAKDFRTMVSLFLDVTAYKQIEPLLSDADEDLTVEDVLEPATPAFWDVDPALVYPNRNMEIRMGSGFIVDDVGIRDDFTAKLISRRHALRKRGYTDKEIEEILDEIDQEAGEAQSRFLGTEAPPTPGPQGSRLNSTSRENADE